MKSKSENKTTTGLVGYYFNTASTEKNVIQGQVVEKVAGREDGNLYLICLFDWATGKPGYCAVCSVNIFMEQKYRFYPTAKAMRDDALAFERTLKPQTG